MFQLTENKTKSWPGVLRLSCKAGQKRWLVPKLVAQKQNENENKKKKRVSLLGEQVKNGRLRVIYYIEKLQLELVYEATVAENVLHY